MSNIEHLIENSLIIMPDCNDYNEWQNRIINDINWQGVNMTLNELWDICQYVIYTLLPLRCDMCTSMDTDNLYEDTVFEDTVDVDEDIVEVGEKDYGDVTEEWARLWSTN